MNEHAVAQSASGVTRLQAASIAAYIVAE